MSDEKRFNLPEIVGPIALFSAGVFMILVAALNLEHEIVCGILIVVGASCIALGAVVHRAEGPLKFGKDGLETYLATRDKEARAGQTTPISEILPTISANDAPRVDAVVPDGAPSGDLEDPDGASFTKILPKARVELTEGAKRDLDQYEPSIRSGILSSILQTIAITSGTNARKHSNRGSLDYFTAQLGPSMTVAYREADKTSPDGEDRVIVLGIYPADS